MLIEKLYIIFNRVIFIFKKYIIQKLIFIFTKKTVYALTKECKKCISYLKGKKRGKAEWLQKYNFLFFKYRKKYCIYRFLVCFNYFMFVIHAYCFNIDLSSVSKELYYLWMYRSTSYLNFYISILPTSSDLTAYR